MLGACHGGADKAAPVHELAIYTSLPLFWAESGDIAGALAQDGPAHWVLDALAQEGGPERGAIHPLDTLTSLEGMASLREHGVLLMVQPRPLSPQENVALDAWVRAGGHLLLFADPMLAMDSAFAPGDPRRPQDVALLSPILGHWGLEMFFDPDQPPQDHAVALPEGALPVRLAGRLERFGKSGDAATGNAPLASCAIEAAGLLADCSIGQGRALILADATLFDADASDTAERGSVLRALIARAYAQH